MLPALRRKSRVNTAMDHGLIFLLTFLVALGVWTAKAAKRDQAGDPLEPVNGAVLVAELEVEGSR